MAFTVPLCGRHGDFYRLVADGQLAVVAEHLIHFVKKRGNRAWVSWRCVSPTEKFPRVAFKHFLYHVLGVWGCNHSSNSFLVHCSGFKRFRRLDHDGLYQWGLRVCLISVPCSKPRRQAKDMSPPPWVMTGCGLLITFSLNQVRLNDGDSV